MASGLPSQFRRPSSPGSHHDDGRDRCRAGHEQYSDAEPADMFSTLLAPGAQMPSALFARPRAAFGPAGMLNPASCPLAAGAPASAGGHHVITLRAMRLPARLAVPPVFGAVLAVALAAAPASAAPTGAVPAGAVPTGTVHASEL